MHIKYVLQNLNVLKGFLIIVTAAMSYYIVIPILHPDIGVSLPVIKETITETNTISILPQNVLLSDYALIGNQNLFHPERIIPPEKKGRKGCSKTGSNSLWDLDYGPN